MKRKLILLVAALMAIGQNAFAYDFSAVAPSGQTLYYKIIDPVNHYVKVTYPNDEQVSDEILNPWGWPINQAWDTYSRPTGILVIPDTVSYNGVVYTVRTIGAGAFCDCPYITSVVMPNTVDSIGKSAFLNCNNLSNVTFSNSLRYIGENSFMSCHLGEVVLPPSVRTMETRAMFNAHITSITLNDSIEKLGGACLEDNQFTSLYFPASVNSIGSIRLCFVNSIMVDPNNPYFDSRNSCNAVIKKANDELVISCRNTIIPESVEILGYTAFCGCEFETMQVPSSVITIDASWEMHVNKLVLNSPIIGLDSYWWGQTDTIQLLNENPPIFLASYINENVRYDIPIIVPCNTLSVYQTSVFWSNFTNIRELGTPQITVNAEHGSATVVTYPSCGNDTATVSATADEEHYHFVGWSDGSTQNPYTLVLNGNTSLTAIFAIDSALVDATSANPLLGTVMGGGVVALNETTTLTAIPTGDNVFLSWSNGVTNNPYTLTATTDTVLQAFFTLPDTIVLYDTVDVLVHDTTYVQVHDTTIEYVDHYIHDTVDVLVHDTIYVQVHDTTIEYVNHYIHDTTFVNNYIHDTMIQYVNHYIHDTTFVNNYVHDTVRITTQMFDTTIVNVYQFDTAIYNTYQYDTLFVNNHYYDTVFVHLHDTIYITEQGIGEVEGLNARVYSSHGQIVVEGADGNMVTLYDITGRVLETKQDDFTPLRFDAPVSGTYMIKIGKYPARKVVVIR